MIEPGQTALAGRDAESGEMTDDGNQVSDRDHEKEYALLER